MNYSATITCLLVLFFVQACTSLTIEGLRRLLNEERNSDARPEPFPDEAAISDSVSRINVRDRSFIRPVASVAGRPVIPRRWTYNQPISDVFIDENGIAFPLRPQPSVQSILRSRGWGNH